ncbi:hypothetical protein C8R45DRAFT_1001351 [Mycena sanguinolenta]|nr:hypothetical protein C8R45DRAFT_1001351 [Mycena sanguinolenta]
MWRASWTIVFATVTTTASQHWSSDRSSARTRSSIRGRNGGRKMVWMCCSDRWYIAAECAITSSSSGDPAKAGNALDGRYSSRIEAIASRIAMIFLSPSTGAFRRNAVTQARSCAMAFAVLRLDSHPGHLEMMSPKWDQSSSSSAIARSRNTLYAVYATRDWSSATPPRPSSPN